MADEDILAPLLGAKGRRRVEGDSWRRRADLFWALGRGGAVKWWKTGRRLVFMVVGCWWCDGNIKTSRDPQPQNRLKIG